MHTQTIDIFLEVIDHYGDMGFVGVFVSEFLRRYPTEYHFRVFTDDEKKVRDFFSCNHMASIEITSYDQSTIAGSSTTAIAFFHAQFPRDRYELVLRVDYISLDPTWVAYHGMEHIDSREGSHIIELIPSPLWWAGLLPVCSHQYDRSYFLKKYRLSAADMQKKWYPIFVYEDTLNRMDRDLERDDTLVWICGHEIPESSSVRSLPWMPFDEFYSLLSLADGGIVRWEVSFAEMLQLGKSFFWDIYHHKGGFPDLQASAFLAYQDRGEVWEQFQKTLWGTGKWSLTQCLDILDATPPAQHSFPEDGVTVIKKYLDKKGEFI